MKTDTEGIIYAISVSDIQEVSQDVLERSLNEREIASVRDAVGNYIDWSQAIENAIRERIPE